MNSLFLDKLLVGHERKMFRVICKDEKFAVHIALCMKHYYIIA